MSWIDCGNVRMLILFTIEVMIATVKIKRSISVVSHLRRLCCFGIWALMMCTLVKEAIPQVTACGLLSTHAKSCYVSEGSQIYKVQSLIQALQEANV